MHLIRNGLLAIIGAHAAGARELPPLACPLGTLDLTADPVLRLMSLKRCPTDPTTIQSHGLAFFQGFLNKEAGARERWYEYLHVIRARVGDGTALPQFWSEFVEKLVSDGSLPPEGDTAGYGLEALAVALLNTADPRELLEAAERHLAPKMYRALFSLWPFVPEERYETITTTSDVAETTRKISALTHASTSTVKQIPRGVHQYHNFFSKFLAVLPEPEKFFAQPEIEASALQKAMTQEFSRATDATTEEPVSVKDLMRNLILEELGDNVWLRIKYLLQHQGPLLVGNNPDLRPQWRAIADYTYALRPEAEEDHTFLRLLFLIIRHGASPEEASKAILQLNNMMRTERFCRLFYSQENREQLTIVANLQPQSIRNYRQATKLALSICIDSDSMGSDSLKPVNSLELLGPVENFRINELLDQKQVSTLVLMNEYIKTGGVSEATLAEISEPIQLSSIFVSLTLMMDRLEGTVKQNTHLYRGLFAMLTQKKGDLFEKSVRSVSYRNLLLKILAEDQGYFQTVCQAFPEACSSLIEKSLRDIDLNSHEQTADWARKASNFTIFAARHLLCDVGSLHACKQALFKPDARAILKLTSQLTDNDCKRNIVPVLVSWLPPLAFRALEATQLSEWLAIQALSGPINSFKGILSAGGKELRDNTQGIMYAMLAVVHNAAGGVMPLLHAGKRLLHATSKEWIPSLADLCAHDRCLEERRAGRNFNQQAGARFNYILGEIPTELDRNAVPTKPESNNLSDQFFYFLALNCTGKNAPWQIESPYLGTLARNVRPYLKYVFTNMTFDDYDALWKNLQVCFKTIG